MWHSLKNTFRHPLHSLSFKLSFPVGLVIFLAVFAAAWLLITDQQRQAEQRVKEQGKGFTETVRRATFYSMLRNERESLYRIIQDVAQQPGIELVRVFNKDGSIMFSSQAAEIGQMVDKKAEACYGCHSQDVPLSRLPAGERSRIFVNTDGERVLSTILPIYNEPACSGPPCHAHPPDQQVLGVLDVALNLTNIDLQLDKEFWQTLAFAIGLFLCASTIVGLAVILTVNMSVKRLMTEVDKVSDGQAGLVEMIDAPDELGDLARAVDRMARSVSLRSQQQEQRYGELVRNSTDAVFVVDSKGRLLMANPEVGRILGRPADSLEGLNVAEVLAEADRAKVRAATLQAFGRNEPSDLVRFKVLASDGRTRVLEGRFRRLLEDNTGNGGLLGNLRDITEQEALESELVRARAFEQKLINQAINAIVATDAAGTIQVFNQSAESLFGYQSAEVVGSQTYGQFFPRAQTRLLKKTLFDAPRPGVSLVRPFVIKAADDRRLPVMLSARCLYLENEFRGVVMFLQNLRESKHLKAQLLRKARLAAVGQTAAGLAHCIKNLLHGLGTASYLVDQGLNDGDQELIAQGWRMVRNNLDQMTGLTQDLLAYAKDRRPQYQPFNLNALLAETAQLVAGRAKEAGVDVRLQPDPTCDRVLLDPFGIRRVVLNLVTNALDALAGQPAPAEPPVITLRSGRDAFGMVHVSVIDNGPGVPQEVKRQLFQRLFSTKGSRGTGLGLLVSQKIVEEHGGVIDCLPNPPRGTRFTFTVPDLGDAQNAAAGPAEDEPNA